MEDALSKEKLIAAGILHEPGHFVGTNTEHLSAYLDLDSLYEPSNHVLKEAIGRDLASCVQNWDIEFITGPAEGGNYLARLLAECAIDAEAIINRKDAGSFKYAEKDIARMQGKKVLVVDDVFRTGSSLEKISNCLATLNIPITGFAVVVNRHPLPQTSFHNLPLVSLLHLPLESWSEEACPLCLNGVPVNTERGHGKEFLEKTKK